MEVLTNTPQRSGNTNKIAKGHPDSKSDFKKSMAIEAYIRAQGLALPPVVPFDLKIVDAVKRWTTHENVRIGFYIAWDSGKIRVKIIKNDTGEETGDMSLTTFMDSSPATA
jgi:hypothetical protein